MTRTQSPDPRLVRLTPDFTLGDFLHPDDAIPAPWVLDNLYRLANRLQVVQDLLGRPIQIHTAYLAVQPDIQESKMSGEKSLQLHQAGLAADIIVPGLAARDVQLILMNWSGGMGISPHLTHLDLRSYRARWKHV